MANICGGIVPRFIVALFAVTMLGACANVIMSKAPSPTVVAALAPSGTWRMFLPSKFPAKSGCDGAARMVPASTMGGDFYDFIELPDKGTVTTFAVINIPFAGQRIKPPYVAAYVLLAEPRAGGGQKPGREYRLAG